MKKLWLLNIAIPLLFSFMFLIAGNALISKYQIKQQHKLSQSFLDYAVRVRSDMMATIDSALHAKIKSCSDKDLGILRDIRAQFKYTDDIGVVKDDHIICTAVWGVLEKKLKLEEHPYTSHRGYRFYSLGINNKMMKSMQPASVLGNIIAFPSAVSFSDYNNVFTDYRIKIFTEDALRVFYDSNETKTVINTPSLFGITDRICNSQSFLCVETYNPQGGMSALNWMVILLVMLLGSILGWFTLQYILAQVSNRKSIEYRLLRAIEQKNIYMMYQPIVRAGDRKIISFEALVRWNDDLFGQVSPEVFINLSEKIGVYHKLSRIIVDKTMEDLHLLLVEYSDIRVSINICDMDLNDENYIQYILSKCRKYNINPTQIKLEITEKCISDYKNIAMFCHSAKQHGMTVSLDDFGTGSSNIAWLTDLNFDEIKIDRILVNYLSDETQRALILSIVDSLKKTHKQLVFEGVEMVEQLELIRIIDPQFLVQGWFTGKPLFVDNIKDLVQKGV